MICVIEYALKDEGCNEIPVAMLFDRVRKTRGNLDLSMQDFMIVLRGLEKHGLWNGSAIPQPYGRLANRGQQPPSVPFGDAMRL